MSGLNTVITRVIESVGLLKTYIKNQGIKKGQSHVHSALHQDVLVDPAKANHYGFGFLFPAKNQTINQGINKVNGVDPHNPNGLHSGMNSGAPPYMLPNPIEVPSSSSMPIVNHVFNDSSSIGGVNHTSINSPSMGLGSGFSNSPF